ncbi:MerR family transcriptional regulator [Paraburkholderia megapolitana]|nr:MerR family transcriptional regulator [Paraburkholderia megapolitana]
MKVKLMRIGLLASQTRISATRIRFYEARGLLPPPGRSLNGYREYDARAMEILLFIDRARRLGFSLAEVESHLSSPHDEGRKTRLLAIVESKLRALEAQAAQIENQRTELTALATELRTYSPAA